MIDTCVRGNFLLKADIYLFDENCIYGEFSNGHNALDCATIARREGMKVDFQMDTKSTEKRWFVNATKKA